MPLNKETKPNLVLYYYTMLLALKPCKIRALATMSTFSFNIQQHMCVLYVHSETNILFHLLCDILLTVG